MSRDDRRVQRTQQALRRAMMELIMERGFEETSVSDITERANVGRSTFYAHYADKEDLLQGSLEGLGIHLRELVAASAPPQSPGVHPALAFCLPMLEHAGEYRAIFAAMEGKRSGILFTELLHEVWAELVRTSWSDADEVAVQSIAGGLGATISWWLSAAPELSAVEVDRRFRALFERALGEP